MNLNVNKWGKNDKKDQKGVIEHRMDWIWAQGDFFREICWAPYAFIFMGILRGPY